MQEGKQNEVLNESLKLFLAPLGSQPPRPSVFNGIQGCRLPALQPLKPFKPSKPCKLRPFQGNPPSRPLAPLGSQPPRPPSRPLAPLGSQPPRPTVFKAAVCPPSVHAPRPSVFKGIQGCPPSNPSNPSNPPNPPNPPQAFPRQPSKQAPCTSWQPATTAICF